MGCPGSFFRMLPDNHAFSGCLFSFANCIYQFEEKQTIEEKDPTLDGQIAQYKKRIHDKDRTNGHKDSLGVVFGFVNKLILVYHKRLTKNFTMLLKFP